MPEGLASSNSATCHRLCFQKLVALHCPKLYPATLGNKLKRCLAVHAMQKNMTRRCDAESSSLVGWCINCALCNPNLFIAIHVGTPCKQCKRRRSSETGSSAEFLM